MLPPLGGVPGGLMDWGSLKSKAALKTRSFKLLTELSIIPHLIFYHSSGIICLNSTTFSNCTDAEDTGISGIIYWAAFQHFNGTIIISEMTKYGRQERDEGKKSCITSLSVIESCISFHPEAVSAFPSQSVPTSKPFEHITQSQVFFLAPISIWTCFVHSFLLLCCLTNPAIIMSSLRRQEIFCHIPLCILKAQNYGWHKGGSPKRSLNDWMND